NGTTRRRRGRSRSPLRSRVMSLRPPTRRHLLQQALAWCTLPVAGAGAQPALAPPTRPIPSSGEALPVVGLGSWITFNVGRDAAAAARCAEVMRAFVGCGGPVVGSSPMYGSSQEVIGHGLRRSDALGQVFAADKVWVAPASRGPAQIETSRAAWGVPRFDL